jgi:hypothetical protein
VELPPPPDDPRELSALPGAPLPGSADYPEEPRSTSDPLGVIAIVCGCIGILVGGVLLAIITGVLAAAAGQQARAAGRSPDNAYIAFVLAGVDGVVWLVLHMLFDLNFLAG